jgi:hypothetical protein
MLKFTTAMALAMAIATPGTLWAQEKNFRVGLITPAVHV